MYLLLCIVCRPGVWGKPGSCPRNRKEAAGKGIKMGVLPEAVKKVGGELEKKKNRLKLLPQGAGQRVNKNEQKG